MSGRGGEGLSGLVPITTPHKLCPLRICTCADATINPTKRLPPPLFAKATHGHHDLPRRDDRYRRRRTHQASSWPPVRCAVHAAIAAIYFFIHCTERPTTHHARDRLRRTGPSPTRRRLTSTRARLPAPRAACPTRRVSASSLHSRVCTAKEMSDDFTRAPPLVPRRHQPHL